MTSKRAAGEDTTSSMGVPVFEASDVGGLGPSGPQEPVQIGQKVADKYRIDRVLGSSGMGIVYLAEHEEIGQWVAIKFLLEAAKNPQAFARFKREARVMAKIKNKHAVRIVDVGQLNEDTPYIVMEYLEGRDLSTVMKSNGPMPIPMACDVAMQVAEALASAHAAGVVHRDLKPSNIFLSPLADGSQHVTVIDFGVAKLRSGSEDGKEDGKKEEVTHTSMLIGSPRYMSPEQVSASRNVDHRADVWALGVILQEMLTGQRVFKGEGIGLLLAAIAAQPAPPIQSLLPAIPGSIAELMHYTLQKDPSARTPNVAEFAAPLASFVADGESRLGRIRSILGDGSPASISTSGARRVMPLGQSGSWPTASSAGLVVPGSTPSLSDVSAGSTASLAAVSPTPQARRAPVALMLLLLLLLAGAGVAAVVVLRTPSGAEVVPSTKPSVSAVVLPALSAPAASGALEFRETAASATGVAPPLPKSTRPVVGGALPPKPSAAPTPKPVTTADTKKPNHDPFDDPR
jgi:eukaryotic-like serine/threonine-protein kinase